MRISLCGPCFFGDGTPSTKHSNEGLDFSVTDSSLLQDNVAFVLCLDTLGRGDSLHLHVSKPPKEGTLQHVFLRELEMVIKSILGRWELGTYYGELQLSKRGRNEDLKKGCAIEIFHVLFTVT